jgi:hypothetical protein
MDHQENPSNINTPTSRQRHRHDKETAETDDITGGLQPLKETAQGNATGHDVKGKCPKQSPLLVIAAHDLVKSAVPPRHTIDLSLPPRQRYVTLARVYKEKLTTLPILFDEVLEDLHQNSRFLIPYLVKRLARLLLRRVHDSEQMEELIGIQQVTGMDMYLLIAFNVLLDMFVGCTSGGVRVMEQGKVGRRLGDSVVQAKKMMHFRTLDWEMDPLRQIVVQLDFVARDGGPVVARSVTYLGFVGVLTGVR